MRFKLNQLVYATRNSAWGMEPMKVVRAFDDYVRCSHPDFLGEGLFDVNEVEPVTPERTRKLKKLAILHKWVKETEFELF